MKDRTYLSDRLPKGQHYHSTQSHSVKYLIWVIIGLYHFDVEATEDWDAVDGEVGGGDEEAGGWGYDDGYECWALFFEGEEGVDEGKGVGEEGDGDN